jgi:prepilin-type N-terminal cleavage/methylation domain-containing protein
MTRRRKGFTVIELLIGMLITSIVLSAVATFAYALSVASTISSDTALEQAQLRQATVRIGELIGACKLLCAAPGNDLVLWRSDDNADNQINLNELVYIERGDTCTMLRLCGFASPGNPHVALGDLAVGTTKAQLQSNGGPVYALLVPQCKDAGFAFYPVPPPLTRATCLRVFFTLSDSSGEHPYEIVAALRGHAANLLNEAGDALVATDDD